MTGPDGFTKRYRVGRLGQNTVLYAGGMGARAVIQAAYLVLLSRWMGPEGYGYFAGSVAAAVILSPLAGWGVSFLIARNVGLDATARGAMWATALNQIALSGIVLVSLVMLASAGLLDHRVSTSAMLMLAIAELVALPMANTAAGLALAVDKGWAATVATMLVPAGRLSSVGAWMASGGHPSPDAVAAAHLCGSLLGAAAAFLLMARIGARPQWQERLPMLSAARVGMSHAFGTLVGVSYLELDKVILLQVVDAATAGAYTVAFRAVALFVLPVTALVASAIPRLLTSAGGPAEPVLRRAIQRTLVGYAILATALALVSAPLLPMVFGPGYSGSSRYMVMLAPWIMIFAAHQYLGTRLTTSDRQGLRLAIESGGMVLLLALNLHWIPELGADGAVAALYCAELVMILAFAWRGGRKTS
ncbi:lipopolysaccharide biosynthesis protein [Arenimonas sp. MALMAid1274]|uniref:lipopolysaccharide biosynthesis protein n=1 Tax=Arenimonas sp. MALMAid1274 TaxID=3411630 RepID=UPI003B9E6FBE